MDPLATILSMTLRELAWHVRQNYSRGCPVQASLGRECSMVTETIRRKRDLSDREAASPGRRPRPSGAWTGHPRESCAG